MSHQSCPAVNLSFLTDSCRLANLKNKIFKKKLPRDLTDEDENEDEDDDDVLGWRCTGEDLSDPVSSPHNGGLCFEGSGSKASS